MQMRRKLNRNLTFCCKFLQQLLIKAWARKRCSELIFLLVLIEGVGDARSILCKLIPSRDALKKSEMDKCRYFWVYGSAGFVVAHCLGQRISVVHSLT